MVEATEEADEQLARIEARELAYAPSMAVLRITAQEGDTMPTQGFEIYAGIEERAERRAVLVEQLERRTLCTCGGHLGKLGDLAQIVNLQPGDLFNVRSRGTVRTLGIIEKHSVKRLGVFVA